MGQIIVGMDTSTAANNALRWAMREAELRQWDITAVMVWSHLDQAHAGPGGRFDPDYSQKTVSATLDDLVEQVVGAERSKQVGRLVLCDLTARGLLEAAQDADLLVVGARGLGGFRALMLGSVSEQCLHHAPCPVAIVRDHTEPDADTATRPSGDREPGERPRVVVGVDGSLNAQEALRWAIDEASVRQAQLELVHAWRHPVVGFGPSAVILDSAVLETDAQEVLRRALAAEDTTSLPVPAQFTTLSGSPASVLLTAAKGADLVVTGSRGRGGFKGLLLGSTSHQVARHATSPVIVVPIPDRG